MMEISNGYWEERSVDISETEALVLGAWIPLSAEELKLESLDWFKGKS